ncbi:hypothetical protein Bbelb_241410 [Branchiostoma belcheri]|nr:hypothetical protein Bbelb_241410 [Branchiostoma belcheri]
MADHIIRTAPGECRDCAEIYAGGSTTSGVYLVTLQNNTPVEVYCDMDTDGAKLRGACPDMSRVQLRIEPGSPRFIVERSTTTPLDAILVSSISWLRRVLFGAGDALPRLTQLSYQIDDNIKFTQEPSHDNMLPFLDTKTIVEEDGNLRFEVYRKPTHTDQYLAFDSHHPLEHKLAVIKTLFHRADNIVTSDQAKTDEQRHLRGALAKCGYQNWTFNKALKPSDQSKKTQKYKPLTNKNKANITIPYVQGVSEKLRRIFQNFNIATNFKPHSTLRQRLVHPKDRPHKGTKANVIYRLKCEEPNCNNTYIGETSRPLKVRYKEHCRPSANGYSSAIFHHLQHNQGHSFKLESTDVLDRETRWWERGVKEAIYERMYNPTLNREGGLRVDLSGTCIWHSQPRGQTTLKLLSCGGWTVIQRRVDGTVPFNRTWEEYKRGFGNKDGEHWLGNDNIHLLTNQKDYRLQLFVKGRTFTCTRGFFKVSDEMNAYRLVRSNGRPNGNCDLIINAGLGCAFSTEDRDNFVNCAMRYGGGWWCNMCGIWAIFGSDEDVSKQCVSALRIGHRGPDCFRLENINHFKNCCFGFHRLAIVGDMYGMQPMRVHRYPQIWLCFNGEIYNYRKIAEQFGFNYETGCDGEAIISLYMHGGIEFAAKHLDGVFAFILLDTQQKRFYIAGVLGLMGVSHDNDDNKVDIEPFPPGHFEAYDLSPNGKVTLRERARFHKIGDMPKYDALVKPQEKEDIYANIRVLLEGAVKKRLIGGRRIGCLLSGRLQQ